MKDSELTISRLQKKDCADAGSFCKSAMRWMHKKYLKGVYPLRAVEFDIRIKSSAQLAKMLKDSDSYGFVARSDGKVSGVLLGKIFGKSGLAKINWIAVDPKHQHEGIGIRLMTAAEDYLRGKKCHKIYLNTLPPLIPAIRL